MEGIKRKAPRKYSLLMIPFSLGLYLLMNTIIRSRVLPYIIKLLRILNISDLSVYTVYSIWMGVMILTIILFCVSSGQMGILLLRKENFLSGMTMGWYVWLYSAATIIISYQGGHTYRRFSYILSAVFYYILVAVCEEIIFRGLIQNNALNYLKESIKNKTKAVYISILISSLLFAAIHLSNAGAVSRKALLIQIAGAFVYGLLFGIITYKTDSLLSVIVLHAINDIASAYAVIILKTGKTAADIINGYGVMEFIALLPVLTYCIFLFYKDFRTCNIGSEADSF